MLDTGAEGVYDIAVTPFAETGKTDDDLTGQSPRGRFGRAVPESRRTSGAGIAARKEL
jgi:hypothetical protein